jgi:hypothetical protein
MVVKNELQIALRIIEFKQKKHELGNISFKGAFATPDKSVREKTIMVTVPGNVPLPSGFSSMKHCHVKGSLKVSPGKFGGMLYSIVADEIRECTDIHVNKWALSLILDKRPSNREKTAYWNAFHIRGMESVAITLRAGNNGEAFSEFREGQQVIVDGSFDMVFNGIMRKTTFYIDVGSMRQTDTDTVPIPLEYANEQERDINSFVSVVGAVTTHVFRTCKEVFEAIAGGLFTPEQGATIETNAEAVASMEKTAALDAAENKFFPCVPVAKEKGIRVLPMNDDEEPVEDDGLPKGFPVDAPPPGDPDKDGHGGEGIATPDNLAQRNAVMDTGFDLVDGHLNI